EHARPELPCPDRGCAAVVQRLHPAAPERCAGRPLPYPPHDRAVRACELCAVGKRLRDPGGCGRAGSPPSPFALINPSSGGPELGNAPSVPEFADFRRQQCAVPLLDHPVAEWDRTGTEINGNQEKLSEFLFLDADSSIIIPKARGGSLLGRRKGVVC